MDEAIKRLQGSESRDTFKRMHKQLDGRRLWSCDLDFLWVENSPPGIVAVLDYKRSEDDPIRFSEILAYNELMKIAWVYIVIGNPSGPFCLKEYRGGNWKTRACALETILSNATWEEIGKYEESVRAAYRGGKRAWKRGDTLQADGRVNAARG